MVLVAHLVAAVVHKGVRTARAAEVRPGTGASAGTDHTGPAYQNHVGQGSETINKDGSN